LNFFRSRVGPEVVLPPQAKTEALRVEIALAEAKAASTAKAPEFCAAKKTRRKAEEPRNVTRVSTTIQQNINLKAAIAERTFVRRATDNMQDFNFWQVEKLSYNLPRVIGLQNHGASGSGTKVSSGLMVKPF
jgi:hypothetical protein